MSRFAAPFPSSRIVLSLIIAGAALLAITPPASQAVVARGAQPFDDDCEQLVVNGGFENGRTGWREYSSDNYELIDAFYQHSGANSAWLGANNNEEDWISQTVTLPASGGSLRLNYWWSVYTEENPGGAFDFMKAQLLRADGTLLVTLATYDNESAEAWLWNLADLDLSPYAGATVQLRFWAKNDANNPTSFFIDDVAIESCPAAATSTATPTLPPTATRTATPSPTASITPGPSLTPTSTPSFWLYLPLVLR